MYQTHSFVQPKQFKRIACILPQVSAVISYKLHIYISVKKLYQTTNTLRWL